MNVKFISMQFSDNDKIAIDNSKTMPQYSANHVSKMFVEGLNMNDEVNCQVINVMPISSWPFGNKTLIIPERLWNKNHIDYMDIPFCNIFGIRQLSKYLSLKRIFKRMKNDDSSQPDVIVAYALSTPILLLFRYLKKTIPGAKTCLIVPDLPAFMNINGNKVYHFMKSIDISFQKQLFKYIDGMVYFSEHMNDYFEFPNEKWIVIEGMIDYNFNNLNKTQNDVAGNKIILYTGAVELAYGIPELIEAFSKIEESSYELHIVGDGSAKNYVIDSMKSDERIKYLGVMNHSDTLAYQRKASVLVNPRKPDNIFTKYSFPSKTLEYMMSGSPIIMYKMDGIPDEYDDYLTYFKSNDPQVMAEQLKDICDKEIDYRQNLAKKAQKFVCSMKNNKKQMENVVKFIKEL